VEAYPVAAGGVAGAEGGLRLLVVGDAAAVREALAIAERVQGEPPLA
jgi:6-phosphogluconate dehydrogenase (decarboxylating)